MVVDYKEGTFVNSRDQTLFTVSYEPAEAPKAALFFHHGYGEHIGRYAEVFTQLAEAGIAVFSFDAHGHGKSGPKQRVLLHSFSHLIDDVYGYVEEVRKAHPSLPPAFIGGHSLGGLVAAHTALRNQARWAGLLLHSAAMDVEWTPVLRIQAKVGNLIAALAPKVRIVPAVRPVDMSVDPVVVQHYVADPLNVMGPVRARTGNEMLKAFRAANKRAAELSLPMYVAHGTGDKCTSFPAAKRFLANASSEDKTFKEFPGAYHELLMGPEKTEAVPALAAWILAHAAAAQQQAKL